MIRCASAHALYVLVASATIACNAPAYIDCPGGHVCPADQMCWGTTCAIPGTVTSCGNGEIDGADVCDDGNRRDGDGCSARCDSNETCGNGVVDFAVGETCEGGPLQSSDGCSSLCQVELVTWLGFSRSSFTLSGTAMATNSDTGQLLAFGGQNFLFGYRDMTLIWDETRWVEVFDLKEAKPDARWFTQMAYDPQRQRMVLFGGERGGLLLGDTWEWDGVQWEEKTPTQAPAPRFQHSMAFSPATGNVMLFGGYTGTVAFGDTWEWNGSDWQPVVTTVAPEARLAAAMDRTSTEVLLFGGYGVTELNDTWRYDGDWHELPAATGPAPSGFPKMVYDSRTATNHLFSQRMHWRWAATSWDFVADHSANLSDVDDYFAAIGLSEMHDQFVFQDASTIRTLRDGSFADGSHEREPSNLDGKMTTAAYDVHRRRMVFVDQAAHTVEFDGANWFVGPTLPSGRVDTPLAYDPIHQNVVLFGGIAASALNDTWTWNGTSWQQRTGAIRPSARSGHALAYAGNGQVVLLGGEGEAALLDDMWLWDGTAWSPNDVAPRPSHRRDAAMAHDPSRQTLLLFGGRTGNSDFLGDTWQWDGTRWLSENNGPPARAAAGLAYNASTKSLWLSGGVDGLRRFDTWEWTGAWQARLPLGQVLPDGSGGFAYDASSGQIVSGVGGQYRLWHLSLYNAGNPRELCVRADQDSDGDGAAGCDDPDCAGLCRPGCVLEASCDETLPHCGDGICNPALETYLLCPLDCP